MTIRWSKISILSDVLNILVTSKIWKTQLDNVDNIRIINKTLSDLWFTDTKLNIKYNGI